MIDMACSFTLLFYLMIFTLELTSSADQVIHDTMPKNRLLSLRTVDDYLDICLDGRNHKGRPSKESSLFAQCSPWKHRSCCSESVTKDFHLSSQWYNLEWNHCSQELSPACRSHFLQDLCFYECSPNVGPWLAQVNMKIRKEKFMHVPLCERECNLWWDDCKEDYTCIKNWAKGFNWTTGKNTCPKGAPCKQFKELYEHSKDFCESVWDNSWKVVPNTEPCMVLWFDFDRVNPNNEVAKQRAEELVAGANTSLLSMFSLLPMLSLTCKIMLDYFD